MDSFYLSRWQPLHPTIVELAKPVISDSVLVSENNRTLEIREETRMNQVTLENWKDLCNQVIHEEDPVRLLRLFLKIDSLQSNGLLTRVAPASYEIQQIPCPYCSALLEVAKQIAKVSVLQCPWCDGRFRASHEHPTLFAA